ncbi:uncharacterized protein LOC110448426 [Mizuhopecten yessoensis]|uniref:Uncharacterized protein n=1 Tax=Mizuhopecten yessoensis TaxID=6573 RepID=A0A210QT56_MIZYE|nr:uncharacterized protein LOC110448426 [Mizuhopecten yessoensis]XP_021350328.1 uncharacterized protein LOC110448426 [Mizuhopecten yessoensis]OWF51933.1 hypothetical protein KP79_PYT18491 [Mizuhopecten yessoensis]
MEAKHIEELRQRYRFIVDNIGDPEAVCDELLSLGIFDESYIDKILLKKPAPKAQTKELLYLLKFRGAKAYGKFITALEKSGNRHVAKELMKPESAPEQPEPIIQQESIQPVTAPLLSTDRPIQVQPSLIQPIPTEDAFKSWPEKKGMVYSRKCTEEEKRRLLSDSTVYRITECPEKGFVVRLKCCPQKPAMCEDLEKKIKMRREDFDNCNQCLNNLMSFLDSTIKTGNCTAKLVNKNAEEFERNTVEMIKKNVEELKRTGYFMMFCLSYGPVGAGCGCVFDRDNKCVNLPNMIDMVKQCEALRGKPKIFIVITILDENLTAQEPPEDRTVADAGEDHSSTNEDNLFVFHVYHGQHGTWIKDPHVREMWFMRAFLDVFYAYSYELHLLELIEKVNQLLSNAVVDSQTKTRGHVGGIKVVQKDIRKKLYFFPGIKYQGGQQASS